MKCVLCGAEIEKQIDGIAYGNNAMPLAEGQCCDKCNDERVVPERIKRWAR